MENSIFLLLDKFHNSPEEAGRIISECICDAVLELFPSNGDTEQQSAGERLRIQRDYLTKLCASIKRCLELTCNGRT